MRKIFNTFIFIGLMAFIGSCAYKTDKLPYPEFEEGPSFVTTLVPEPNPVTAANVATITARLSNMAGSSLSFKTQSYNADKIEKVDIYIAHRRGAVSTPVISVVAPHGFLFKTITSFGNTETYPVSEMITATKLTPNDLRAGDIFALKIVATMKDGRVFSADNSGPGINVNPLGTVFRTFLFVNLAN
ncbi:MAG: hypothetical protein MUE81_23030 [Thermoflexibacter sp.]|jgi:hypothetical protein|nr:hypothetical protein [Thermoflexibacter sp.]